MSNPIRRPAFFSALSIAGSSLALVVAKTASASQKKTRVLGDAVGRGGRFGCGDGLVIGSTYAKEHPTHRQTTAAQDCREGQAIPLCQMPEAQPQARQASGAVVLPAVSG